VIATGSRPAVPEAVGAAPYHTSETIFAITEQPRELVILGAGPVGCELAQAFALLGTRVTLLESAPRILSREDADASEILSRRLNEAGVTIRTSHAFERPDGGATLLVATGRAPNVEGLNLEGAGVRYGPNGVEVTDRLQTTNPRVFAAGDICSRFKFTHAADAAARVVIQNALFFGRRRASALVIPWATYTMPEVGRVGSIDGDAITIRLADVDRAVVDDDTDGFVRIHHDRGRVAGATIVAAHAGELIGYVASLMRRGGRLDEWSSDIFPYPALSDALRKAGDASRRTRLTAGVRAAFERYFRLARRW
jgi:pyruvate/2-oxoglutarate dehydrogenase complex dihydrolipoamide dehydrogenase (E3) component